MTSEDREDVAIIKARLVALWAAREDARKARSMARRAGDPREPGGEVTKKKAAAPKLPTTQQQVFAALCRKHGIPEPVVEHRFHPTRKWRFDYAWPDHKIALEVEGGAFTGGRHTTGSGFRGDIEKYNEAVRLGWSVLRTLPENLYALEVTNLIGELMARPGTAVETGFAALPSREAPTPSNGDAGMTDAIQGEVVTWIDPRLGPITDELIGPCVRTVELPPIEGAPAASASLHEKGLVFNGPFPPGTPFVRIVIRENGLAILRDLLATGTP